MKPRLLMPMLLTVSLLASNFAAVSLAADARKVGGPAVVFQVKPIDDLLVLLKMTAKNFLPEPILKDIETNVFSQLDLDKIKGVDTTKPFGLYATIGNGILKGDLSGTSVVALVPVSDEKTFLELLGKIDLMPEKKGDVYLLPLPNVPVPSTLRFLKGYAYVCVAPAKIDASALLDPKELFSEKETAVAALHLRMDRLPGDVRNVFLAGYNKNIEQQIAVLSRKIENLKTMGTPASHPILVQLIREETTQRTLRWSLHWMKLLVNSSKELIFRVNLDPKTGILGSEMSLEPRSGSDLAKSVGAMQPTKNTFASIVGADSTGYLLVQAPLFIGDLQEMLANFTLRINQATEGANKADTSKELMALISEVIKALGRTVKDGNLDLAASLRGPDSNKQFTAVGAFSLKDTAAVETALRTAVKSGPKEDLGMFKLDVFKVEGINVHEIAIGGPLPPEVRKVFGQESVYFALLPNAVVVTFGPQGKEVMKETLTAKLGPQPVPLVQAEISRKRIEALFKTLGAPPAALQFIEKLPEERAPVLAIKVEGGDKLVLRVELGLPALWVLAPKPSR